MNFLDPKTDIAFKKLFGTQSKVDITISFLNSILERTGKEKIVSATIGDPYNHPETSGSKLSIVDVRCTDEQGKQYIIEMQLLNRGDYKERCQYYIGSTIASQLKEGAGYTNLKPVIFVGIINFDLLDDEPNYLNHYYLLNDKTYKKGFEHIEIHLVELSKFHKTIDQLQSDTDKWLFLLKEAQTLHEIPNQLADNAEVKKAMGVLERGHWSPRDLEIYRSALDFKISEKAILDKAKLEGKEEVAKKLFGVLTTKEIANATGLSVEEIEQLKKH